uniref:Uncharacterized protein n=1 Tax=Termitomyces sp. TaxID=1916073 RepID=A0A386TYQ8_9AGAR|nr:hypothetical protein C0990_000028 [Termitomyces sp.]
MLLLLYIVIFSIVIYWFLFNIVCGRVGAYNKIFWFMSDTLHLGDFVQHMSSTQQNTNTTATSIVHSNSKDGWAQGVKSLFKDVRFNFIGEDNFNDSLLKKVLEHIKSVIEPVSYSNVILANQIYYISIILFILSLLILVIVIIMGLLINMIIYVYSDKFNELFKNKNIKWYISFTKKNDRTPTEKYVWLA